MCRDTMVSVSARVRIACACNDDGSCALRSRELQSTETQQSTLTVCVSLFYVNDIGSTSDLKFTLRPEKVYEAPFLERASRLPLGQASGPSM